MTNYFRQREEEEKNIPAFRGFGPTAEEKTLDRNPFKVLWSKLIVGDIVTLQEHRLLAGTAMFILSNRKNKVAYLRMEDNTKREKTYGQFDYLYCVSILREGQVCNSLPELQNITAAP